LANAGGFFAVSAPAAGKMQWLLINRFISFAGAATANGSSPRVVR